MYIWVTQTKNSVYSVYYEFRVVLFTNELLHSHNFIIFYSNSTSCKCFKVKSTSKLRKSHLYLPSII